MTVYTSVFVVENIPFENYEGALGVGLGTPENPPGQLAIFPFLCTSWKDMCSREMIIWKDERKTSILSEVMWQSAEATREEVGFDVSSPGVSYAMVGRTPVSSREEAFARTFCVLVIEYNITEHQQRFYGRGFKFSCLRILRRIRKFIYKGSRFTLLREPEATPIPSDVPHEILCNGLRKLCRK